MNCIVSSTVNLMLACPIEEHMQHTEYPPQSGLEKRQTFENIRIPAYWYIARKFRMNIGNFIFQ